MQEILTFSLTSILTGVAILALFYVLADPMSQILTFLFEFAIEYMFITAVIMIPACLASVLFRLNFIERMSIACAVFIFTAATLKAISGWMLPAKP
jgi:hypothetical protein